MWSNYGVNVDFYRSGIISLPIFIKADYDAGYGNNTDMAHGLK